LPIINLGGEVSLKTVFTELMVAGEAVHVSLSYVKIADFAKLCRSFNGCGLWLLFYN